ncbi:hypothetical protein [Sinorhizobium fredii]|uniref:hypothetical protein n=1 Tax=Rhizobium fredii TaxID=380 RepID=UPI0005644145|nr:hypothetical protein [Sinorhizobium fredii]
MSITDALKSNPFVDPARAPINYSVAGIGDCMAPLIPEGATYSMSQTEPVAVGDLVAVFFAEGVFTMGGNFRCKVLTGQTAETIGLTQINPLKALTFKRESILAMHRVVAVHFPLHRTPIDPRALLAPHLRPSSPVKRTASTCS